MKLSAIAATILTAVLTAPINSAQASAVDSARLSGCTGELMVNKSAGTPGSDISIPGVIDCAQKMEGRFFVAVFEVKDDLGYYHAGLTHEYNPLGPTYFDLVGTIMGPSNVRDAGLCLMDELGPLSCVYVTSELIAKPLSTSDPLVGKDLVFHSGGGIEPSCGSCWKVV